MGVWVAKSIDDELSFALDRCETTGASLLVPTNYLPAMRGYNARLGRSAFAVPLSLRAAFAGRALIGAYGLVRVQFARDEVYSYVQTFASSLDLTTNDTATDVPEALQQFLRELLALQAPKQKTTTGFAEAAEHFLREVLDVESQLEKLPSHLIDIERKAAEAVFESLYRIGETAESVTREAFVQRVGSTCEQTIQATDGIAVLMSPTDAQGSFIAIGAGEDASYFDEVTDVVSRATEVVVPVLSVEHRTLVHPHADVVAQVQQNEPNITAGNFFVAQSSHVKWIEPTSQSKNEEVVARASTVISARASEVLTEFDGNVAANDLELNLPRPTSVSFLSSYNECPFYAFVSAELGIEGNVERDNVLGIDPLDRGRVVHEILQRFFAVVPKREEPDQPWTAEERQIFSQVIDETLEKTRARTTSQAEAAFFAAEESVIRNNLGGFLDADEAFRREQRVIPAHQEVWFGGTNSEIPAVTFSEAGVSIAFVGRVDRIDQSLDGDKIIVTDYKTGRPQPANTFSDGPIAVDELQLPVYAEGVARMAPDATVVAQHWYPIDPSQQRNGFVYGQEDKAQLSEWLLESARDYGQGQFPAHPGNETPWGFTNCRYCPFDDVCPADRAETYARKCGETS